MSATIVRDEQQPHAVLPAATSDEFARQEFIKSLKYHLATRIAPGVRSAYRAKREPEFVAKFGRPPADRREVRNVMQNDPYFRFWSALERNSQEMLWASVQIPLERQKASLAANAKTASRGLGSLRLDPNLKPPAYVTAVDIHLMPGNYHTELGPDDVSAGALYDRGVYVYSMGRMGPQNADPGASTAAFVRERFPDLKPRRILDMGCGIGNSTLPYVDAFPEAEVHGIDTGAPVLRYGHARAESMGKAVHFSQQNAEKTDFPDGHFDLIVSHLLVHETSRKALPRILREAHRLLRPGGVMAHLETPPYRTLDPFEAFMFDWDTYNNNEPFWGASHELDLWAEAEAAGFSREKVFEATPVSAYCTTQKKPVRIFKGGEVGGGWRWYVWGAQR